MKFGLSDDVIEELQKVFKRHANITQVFIFGSRAKGNYHEGSDIDLAVTGSDISFDQLLDIRNEIDDTHLLYKIDIVDYEKEKDSPIGRHIKRVGKLFYPSEDNN